MRWFLGLLIAWLALDAFVVQPWATRSHPQKVRVASHEEKWPQLAARKESPKSRRVYTSLAGVQVVHAAR
jgi:hypothetical protein